MLRILEPGDEWFMLPGMKTLILSSLLVLAPAAALAAGPVALGPNGGQYGQWTAATYGHGADEVCYAFTMAQSSTPMLHSRGKVMLTVSERHGSRDEVSVTSGYDYPHDASVKMAVGNSNFSFYTQRNVAFAMDGSAAVVAFKIGNTATSTSSGPDGRGVITDQFSLAGFTAAYDAITHACP